MKLSIFIETDEDIKISTKKENLPRVIDRTEKPIQNEEKPKSKPPTLEHARVEVDWDTNKFVFPNDAMNAALNLLKEKGYMASNWIAEEINYSEGKMSGIIDLDSRLIEQMLEDDFFRFQTEDGSVLIHGASPI